MNLAREKLLHRPTQTSHKVDLAESGTSTQLAYLYKKKVAALASRELTLFLEKQRACEKNKVSQRLMVLGVFCDYIRFYESSKRF